MQEVNIDLTSGIIPPAVCYASQNDHERRVKLNLFDNGESYTLNGSETITLKVKKPSGDGITASVENTSSNYVVISFDRTMTDCFGACLCDLKIEKTDSRIDTMNFLLSVEGFPAKR